MKFGVMSVAAVAAFVGATASAGYVVNARYSEFKRDRFDNQYPTVDDVYSTSGMEELYVPNTGNNPALHRSNLNAFGATYSGYVNSVEHTGPPAGSGRYGYIDTSRFELTFTISEATAFSLVGTLHSYFYASSTLRLDPLTGGASPALLATATGSIDNNFAPNPVNWSGTLLAGQYRLSIRDYGENSAASFSGQYAKSNFVFNIPSPGTALAMLGLAIPAVRRRRGN